MEKDLTLDMMLTERWSNNACRGYVIWAMENCDFKPKDIKRVVRELHWVFDIKPLKKRTSTIARAPTKPFFSGLGPSWPEVL